MTSTVIGGVALEAFAVALFKPITEDLFVLSPISVGRVVAFSAVFPVARTLRAVALAALCVSRTYVHAIAVTLLASLLVTVVSVAISIVSVSIISTIPPVISAIPITIPLGLST